MLSILIPTYNTNLHPLVSELQAQLNESNIEYEIIISDDASSDTSVRYHNSLLAEQYHVQYIQNEQNIGRSKIRNSLADAAKYPTLLFMDCDARVKSSDYISNYIRFLQENNLQGTDFVVLGGLSYREMRPEKTKLLRYRYGIKREVRPAYERNRDPYRAFTPFNMLIAKSVFEKCRFEESLKQYGYEDTFFGIELKKCGIPVYHIDNELYHEGIDTNELLLDKVAAGVANLVNLQSHNKLDDKFLAVSTLLATYQKLKRTISGRFTLSLLGKIKQPLRNIASTYNSLMFLDLYKLSVMHNLLNSDE
ncbi:MAG: glycosyltransferase family 2 protein [Bacteroidales bacterium]|jgi:glycosyltransferase involved in cell wall biosynthesis|nr:glycosyltransferase family 2 protein [Bacteroidales bacterium]